MTAETTSMTGPASRRTRLAGLALVLAVAGVVAHTASRDETPADAVHRSRRRPQ